MSFAFPAFLILLLVLPGIILRYSYLRGDWVNSPFVITSFTDEVAYGVAGACCLHAFWVILAALFHHPVDLGSVLILLIGAYGEHQEYLQAALASTIQNAPWIATYFLSLYFVSAVSGYTLHRMSRYYGWDKRISLLRFHNEWHYLLNGEYMLLPDYRGPNRGKKPDVVYLSTVVVQGDAAYLYRGYIVDYYFDRIGNLDRIVMTATMRRKLEQDRNPGEKHNPQGDKRYYPLEGDLFILKYSEMQTINLQAITLPDTEAVPSSEIKGSDLVDLS